LTYHFAKPLLAKMHANNLSVYVNLVNPFLFHSQSEYDPETIPYAEQFRPLLTIRARTLSVIKAGCLDSDWDFNQQLVFAKKIDTMKTSGYKIITLLMVALTIVVGSCKKFIEEELVTTYGSLLRIDKGLEDLVKSAYTPLAGCLKASNPTAYGISASMNSG
jgi:hypothetical protein